MWSRLSQWRRLPRRLSPDDVRRHAREFLDGWDPFHQRYAHPGEIAVEPIGAEQRWAASVIPARDVRCGLVIDDATGQVVEARLVAMRQGTCSPNGDARRPPISVRRDRASP